MTSAPIFFPCVSRDELRAKKQQEMEAKKPKEPEVDKVRQQTLLLRQHLFVFLLRTPTVPLPKWYFS